MVLGQYTNLTILGGGVVYRTTFNVKNRMCVCVCERERGGGREKDTEEGEGGRERERQRQRNRERETETEKHRDRQTDRQTDRQKDRQAEKKKCAGQPATIRTRGQVSAWLGRRPQPQQQRSPSWFRDSAELRKLV